MPGGTITAHTKVLKTITLPAPLWTNQVRVTVNQTGSDYAHIVELEVLGPYDFLSRVSP